MKLTTPELVVLTHALRAYSDERIKRSVRDKDDDIIQTLMNKVTDEFLTPAPL